MTPTELLARHWMEERWPGMTWERLTDQERSRFLEAGQRGMAKLENAGFVVSAGDDGK